MYLFSTTELHQLLKMPMLAQHFQEHKERNTELTFVDFLYMHYSQPDDHDADSDKDQKLPFKTHDNCISFLTAVYIAPAPIHEFISKEKQTYFFEKQSHFQKNICLTSSFLSNIWQPPKSC